MNSKKIYLVFNMFLVIMTIAGLIILFISLNNKAKAVKIPAWVVSYQDHKVYLVGNIPFGKKAFSL